MVDPIDNVVKQARAGSVAAIIQLLNEQLASSGVRTRAVRENSLLQLLCEAENVEQLEKSTLVPRIQELLEAIGPKNIRRAKINCRIIQEQQMLWLEEINRDPESQLLWVQEIELPKRHLWQNLGQHLPERKTQLAKQSVLKPRSPFERDRQQMRRGLLAGSLLGLLLSLVGWGIYENLDSQKTNRAKVQPPPTTTTSKMPSPSEQNSDPANPTGKQTSATDLDAFGAAVRLAEQAVAAGQVAQTPAQWLEIAAKWQRASDYMSSVPADDNRYKMAQDRKVLYRKSSETALKQAQKRRSEL